MQTSAGPSGIENGNPVRGDNLANIFVELTPTEERNLYFEEILQRWREKTGALQGVESIQFLGFGGGPPGGDIQLDVVGDDPDFLDEAIVALKQKIGTYGGVTDITTDYRPRPQGT